MTKPKTDFFQIWQDVMRGVLEEHAYDASIETRDIPVIFAIFKDRLEERLQEINK